MPAQIDDIKPIQPIGIPKNKYHQKSHKKLLMNCDYYNHKYICSKNGVLEDQKFAWQHKHVAALTQDKKLGWG